ncbi:hypothetical protein OR16_28004 [Cupriavidus basilensis OR16]|uniref:PNPLA domain-containing protein n=1 Tax=Cupriavidus basilensis OR16 TaxID=1127483 RepID=H1SBN7_9BURK|nr:hypothetical protein OR16_28004 [Cupriavidus basilensis OR16]
MPVQEQPSDDELTRISRRRRQLGIARRVRDGDSNWALALSGGGIRSATFCLGVMQALAKAPTPPVAGPALHEVAREAPPDAIQEGDGPDAITPAPAPATTALLGQFDYLSTVSGGGYLGAFFCSLFVPGRLQPGTTPPEAAALAYRTLQHEPPGRIRSSASYAADPGRAAVAWLRENGRYLTPTGAGDTLYAASLVVRNWFAMQYVIGSALLLLLAVLALLRHLAIGTWIDLGRHEMDLLHDARQVFNEGGLAIWWSELLWLPLAALLLFAVPPGVAYWLVYPRGGDGKPALRFDSLATRLAALAGVAMLVMAAVLHYLGPGLVLSCLLLAMAVLTLLAWRTPRRVPSTSTRRPPTSPGARCGRQACWVPWSGWFAMARPWSMARAPMARAARGSRACRCRCWRALPLPWWRCWSSRCGRGWCCGCAGMAASRSTGSRSATPTPRHCCAR